MDRPDQMSDRVIQLYRAVQSAKSPEERQAIKDDLLPKIPRDELPAKRLYVGRTLSGASKVELCDGSGKPRIKLIVESNGEASIVFLDESGKTVRTLSP